MCQLLPEKKFLRHINVTLKYYIIKYYSFAFNSAISLFYIKKPITITHDCHKEIHEMPH